MVKGVSKVSNPQFQVIRELTRVSLPVDDGYLFRLGVALYGFASVSGFMLEIVSYLDPPADRQAISERPAGAILDQFRSAAKKWKGAPIQQAASTAATEFERLNSERSDFVHAYPITGVAGAQILLRRFEEKGKYFEVTDAFLDDFVSRLTRVSDALYVIRDVVT
ncbi:hypothetical protein ABW16_19450 [Mycolicibacter heraklionensis]|uniref:ESX-1 secretion-associated protein EspA/EspE-like domain-containing protein n=2 Tax=Mycolicibacter heraklionensis TaxID=512402 RepID=A0ABR5FB29_9MYCO|nr:hypothetical protein ABW16_19450 [Mycolicibacter heraklionensis]